MKCELFGKEEELFGRLEFYYFPGLLRGNSIIWIWKEYYVIIFEIVREQKWAYLGWLSCCEEKS